MTPIALRLGAGVVGLATAVVLVGVVLLILMLPLYLHPALDASGSADNLGVSASEAHRISDATVRELFLGPGTFAERWSGGQPFYDAAEIRHMQDVRTVLWAFLALAAAGLGVLVVGVARARRQSWFWRAVARGAAWLAGGTVIVGLLFAIAFDQMFTLFHEIFFPGGDWSFNFATERLVQLYPIPFWELTTTVLAVAVVTLSIVVWWLARRRAGGLERAG